MNIYDNTQLTVHESKLLSDASKFGLEQALLDYANELQAELSKDGDEALWIDCLEMAYNELIFNRL